MSASRWAVGGGAVVVLVATAAWARWPTGVDARLWTEIRPVIEARLTADAEGDGPGADTPALRARWFCRAEALELEERAGRVRAGIDAYCLEYGARDGTLVECGGSHFPQVVRLRREADGDFHVVAREEPPDGAGYAEWTRHTFGFLAESRLTTTDPEDLTTAARTHFGLTTTAPVVQDC
ncbi:hypothetical protein ACI2L1_06920 [Streptomyces sp. NPDC019531]|uniref:hypothetical protein n=1 Tax=Streptomyces sp. NPDC019531 TaxID=3365062 RepID=UPI00384CE846